MDHVGQLGTVFALDQDAHIVARQPQDLADIGDGADLVEIGLFRLVALHVALGNEEDHLVTAHGFFHGARGLAPADVKMRHAAGKHHDPAQRQDR